MTMVLYIVAIVIALVAYLVVGLAFVARDVSKPVHEQPEYARNYNMRRQIGGLMFYWLCWPLLLFLKIVIMVRFGRR